MTKCNVSLKFSTLLYRSSDYYNEDISSADAVFVYDYCYVQWMIGNMHANDGLFPHLDVYKGYQRLTRLRR